MSTGSSTSGFADHVLRELRCAGLRARLMTNEIQAMTIALGAGFIDFDNALAHLADVGALGLITTPSSVSLP
jgi:hypothetical protein